MKKNVMRVLIILLISVMMPFPAFAVNEDYIPIQIDGYYDDWDDKPFTEVYPGKNPPESKINYVSLFRDEDYAYVHIIFAETNNQDITNMTIRLYTNMGNESYYLEPDFFWFQDVQSEPDMTLDENTDLGPLEQTPAAEEGSGTESTTTEQETTTTDQGGTTESTDTTNTTESTDTTNTTESTDTNESNDVTEQNILAGREIPSYFLIADNDKTDEAANPETVSTDTSTVTTDEKTNNGQGNGSGNTDGTVTENDNSDAAKDATDEKSNNGQGNGSETNNGQGNEADISVPDTGTATESGISTNPPEDTKLTDILDILNPDNLVDLDNVLDQFSTDEAIDSSVPDNEADLNSNLNLKKPGWYGTWGFTVWDGLFPVGSGYYTRSEGEPDELELYIPLSSVAYHYDGITEISMRIKKLGQQYIMCTGVSTGAYIGVAAGAGIALLGAYTYKRRRPLSIGKGK